MQTTALSAPQHQVLSLLAAGHTLHAAAEAAGVHRNTIHNWRRTSPPFQSASDALAREQSLQWRDEIQSLASLAIDTLRQTLVGADTTPSLRLRAALAVLKHVNTAVSECHQPVEAQPGPAPAVDTSAEIEPQKIVHNSAQSAPSETYRRLTPKTGRNDLCPCGSGQKFKRCCLDQTPCGNPATQTASTT
jgi:hypothetical protein